MGPVALIFGGAAIGDQFATLESVDELLARLESLGICRIDTAGKYPPCAPGLSEELLGRARAVERGFTIDTKINCEAHGKGSLTADAIERSLMNSLSRLRVEKKTQATWNLTAQVNVLYCHRTDPDTPLEQTAAALNEQYRKGRFCQLGLSNFSPTQLAAYMSICRQHKFVQPMVYQGQYNIICRQDEKDLFPLLGKYNMSYIAYSPLAGSALTSPLPTNSRFGISVLYTSNPGILGGIHHLSNILASLSIPVSLRSAALRWLSYHSFLPSGNGNGIILGASQLKQITENVGEVNKGVLGASAVLGVDELWEKLRGEVAQSQRAGYALPEAAKSVAVCVWQESLS